MIRCSAAVQPVTSSAWMFASTRNAGFSSAGPVAVFVTVQSQTSRPCQDVPIDSSAYRLGALFGPSLENLRQLVVPVEPVESNAQAPSSVSSGFVSWGSKPIRPAISSLDGRVPSAKRERR